MPESTSPIGILAFLILFSPSLSGQQSINASGGEAGGIGGTMSFSIGQVAYTAQSGSSGKISQGVQQAYLEIMVSSEEPVSSVSIRLFPNPSSSYTSIALDDFLSADLLSFSYQLFDVFGNYITSADIASSLNSIPTAELVSGMYILKVFYKNQPIKTFRFIKTE